MCLHSRHIAFRGLCFGLGHLSQAVSDYQCGVQLLSTMSRHGRKNSSSEPKTSLQRVRCTVWLWSDSPAPCPECGILPLTLLSFASLPLNPENWRVSAATHSCPMFEILNCSVGAGCQETAYECAMNRFALSGEGVPESATGPVSREARIWYFAGLQI